MCVCVCVCVCACAKSLQLCLTLSDSVDCSPPGFFVHGISQGRRMEWVAISSSRVIFPSQGSNSSLLLVLPFLKNATDQVT